MQEHNGRPNFILHVLCQPASADVAITWVAMLATWVDMGSQEANIWVVQSYEIHAHPNDRRQTQRIRHFISS
jgi:hypothetical protein